MTNLTNLVTLQLKDNNITDISDLSSLNNLLTLKLRGNLISNYNPVASYYSNLTTKDFSLTNEDDVVFRVPNYKANGQLGTVIADLSDTIPEKIYVLMEKFSNNGTLLTSEKMTVNLSGNSQQFNVPGNINCENEAYVTITAYERKDYRQPLSKIIIRPVVFDLSGF